ncbi:MAG: M1 family metallopeptidase [Bacteroidota bacterium]
MKTIFICIFLLLSLQLAIAQKVDVYNRPVQAERSRDFDAIHYKLTLKVDLHGKTLSGENQITLSPLNDNFEKCVLDASYLVVESVISSDGQNLTFEQRDEQVFINFAKRYTHNDTIIFSLKYTLYEPTLGLRFIEATVTNPLMVSTDCFPNKARQWIPCYDFPNDKVTTEMIVIVDKKYKVLSNGRLVSVSENSDKATVTYHWSQELPHSTYLINLSIADYAVIKDSLGSLPINYWVYKGLETDAKTTFAKTPYMINFFNKLYNYSYPWAKYDQVITSYMGGGAEATSATILGELTVMDNIAEKDFSRERIIAHEIAHQWWGDLITLRSWEHTWLNESFGTYSDYLYTRFDKGEDAGAFDLLGKKNQYLNETHNRYMRPIVFNRYNEPGDNFDSHTYPKGACMLHLLRYILGDDTFFRTLSAFLHENEFKPVDTHDFMKTVKEVSGKNMAWFFEQYIFSPGHPVFEVTKYWNESTRAVWTKLATRDPFWAVRKTALENIGKYKDEKSADIFKACLMDKNSKVRVSAVRILGDLKDPKYIELFKKSFRTENSYAVQAELLRSIGKCGGKQQLKFPEEAKSIKSYRNIVSKAATDASSLITNK